MSTPGTRSVPLAVARSNGGVRFDDAYRLQSDPDTLYSNAIFVPAFANGKPMDEAAAHIIVEQRDSRVFGETDRVCNSGFGSNNDQYTWINDFRSAGGRKPQAGCEPLDPDFDSDRLTASNRWRSASFVGCTEAAARPGFGFRRREPLLSRLRLSARQQR